MSDYPALPWTNILDFQLEVGGERAPGDLCRKAVAAVGRLVPFDAAVLHWVDGVKSVLASESREIPQRDLEDYRTYYVHLDCIRPRAPAPTRTIWSDWHEYRETEFVADFLRPLGIRHTAAVLIYDWQNKLAASLVFNRGTSSRGFDEREIAVLDAIQPHLSNLHANLTVPPRSVAPPWANLLTAREAQVMQLLCQGWNTMEIAGRLAISPQTVKKHLANIYAKLDVSNRVQLVAKALG